MHEASLVEYLMDRVEELTPPGARVLRIRLRVGDLSGANAEAMQFCFEALRGEHREPELVIEQEAGSALDLLEIEVEREREDAANDPCAGEAAGQERRTGGA